NILDTESGNMHEIKGKVIINATGVFADEIIKLDNVESKSLIRPSQGIHLVLDQTFLKSKDAIMIPHTDDGRVLFAIPWYDKVIVGTTDTPLDSHSLEPRALKSEVDFILETAGKYLTRQPGRSDVLSVFAGLRPLAATNGSNAKTKEISRSHKVIVSDSGLVSVIGGKWTTYRKMAEDTLDKVIKRKVLPEKECVTMNLRIHGYSISDQPANTLSIYGSDGQDLKELMAEKSEWSDTLSSETNIMTGQVIWAVRKEMARTVEDVLARRMRVLFIDARLAISLAPKVADIMMKELRQDENWKENQIRSFSDLAKGYLLEDITSVVASEIVISKDN
ncbi:MAG TPA: FAD-dependent oxidoreductase, partial [Hanamia sp.]|nr:FAD-dependent oxidoreductase [Hanamia sp.]